MLELNYKTFGQGFPIVILHGLFGTLDNWQTIARRLSEHNMIFLIDQRNHGRSPHTDDIDYPAMAEDLRAFLESQWIFKAHIIGHSMGGKTAMRFALDHGEMVEKLVVVDIAPKTYAGGHETIFDALMSLDLSTVETRQDAQHFLQARIPEEGTVLFLMKNLSRTKEGSFEWKMNLRAIYNHYQEILAGVESNTPFEGSTLFIRGQNSNYIQDSDWPAIQRLFPAAQLATVPNAGHWVHADAPEALVQLLLNELDA